jgi:hypothetical protein
MKITYFDEKNLFKILSKHHFIFDIVNNNFYYHFFNHIIIYGVSQIQKLELIRLLLKNYFHNIKPFYLQKTIININNKTDTIQQLNKFTECDNYINNISIQLIIYKSPIHWEIDFNYTGNNTNNITNRNSNDYYIILHLIHLLCKNTNIDLHNTKIIIFHNIHKIQPIYQKMLFQTMEKHFNYIKFIFITDYINRVENSLISRCMLVRLPLYYKINNQLYNFNFNFMSFQIVNDIIHPIIYVLLTDNYDIYLQNHMINNIFATLLQNKLNSINHNYIVKYNPLKYFDNIHDYMYNIIIKKNKNKISDYLNLLNTIHLYFLDCHYINEFFLIYISSFLNSNLYHYFIKLCHKGNINNKKTFDFDINFIDEFNYIIYHIIKKIAKLDYHSLSNDYNNYIIENFVSYTLYKLIEFNDNLLMI